MSPPPWVDDDLQMDMRFEPGFTEDAPADGCIMCSQCLAACPTYQETGDLDFSPMGRIRVMRDLVEQEQSVSDHQFEQLASCLQCQRCEAACPSQVQYIKLLNQNLREVRHQRPVDRLVALMQWMVMHPGWMRLSRRLATVYQKTGMQALLRNIGLIKRLGLLELDAMIRPSERVISSQEYYPATVTEIANVALFTGCVTSEFNGALVTDSISLLNQLGVSVRVPPAQGCCGALFRHHGQMQQAVELAQRNLSAFATQPVDAIISLASGCGACLKEYGGWFEDQTNDKAGQFSDRVMDISAYIDQLNWPADLQPQPLKTTVAVHTPCTFSNHTDAISVVLTLLRQIPDLEPVVVTGKGCCGAGGTQMLTHRVLAKRLSDNLLNEIDQNDARILVTSNIGCLLHVSSGLQQRNLAIEIMHPVQLIVRQLKNL